MEFLVPLVVAGDEHTGEQIRVAADELGGRVHHDVRAVLERSLEQRRGERAVDRHHRAGTARRPADGRQVGDGDQRVLGRFEPHQIAVLHRIEPRRRVGLVETADGPAPLRLALGDEPRDAVVRVGRYGDVRADRQAVEHDRGGRHPRTRTRAPVRHRDLRAGLRAHRSSACRRSGCRAGRRAGRSSTRTPAPR